KLVIKDANEEQLLDFLSKNKARIIVAPLSNGFIFGRGNQQISWRVIKKVGKEGIIVVATPQKLALLKKLRVDADEVNEILRGEMRVIIGFGLSQLMEVE
ncbi:MAG: ATP-NAD kinase, partial [Thermoplasmata archaeon]|nr:ATP-NAD kinase [Thermoplasmata archaeon]